MRKRRRRVDALVEVYVRTRQMQTSHRETIEQLRKLGLIEDNPLHEHKKQSRRTKPMKKKKKKTTKKKTGAKKKTSAKKPKYKVGDKVKIKKAPTIVPNSTIGKTGTIISTGNKPEYQVRFSRAYGGSTFWYYNETDLELKTKKSSAKKGTSTQKVQKPKFKVGDTVKVKSWTQIKKTLDKNLKHPVSRINFNDTPDCMKTLCGKTIKIKDKWDNRAWRCKDWVWDEDWLEPAPKTTTKKKTGLQPGDIVETQEHTASTGIDRFDTLRVLTPEKDGKVDVFYPHENSIITAIPTKHLEREYRPKKKKFEKLELGDTVILTPTASDNHDGTKQGIVVEFDGKIKIIGQDSDGYYDEYHITIEDIKIVHKLTPEPEKKKTGTKEWAETNKNFLTGCEHNCRYCYARHDAVKRFKRVSQTEWQTPQINKKNYNEKPKQLKGRIMFPSSHDILPEYIDETITYLRGWLEKDNQILIVSKPHLDCIDEITERLCYYDDQIVFRFTIGSMHEETLDFWDTDAPSFEERFNALKLAHKRGFKTSVSIEPYLDKDVDKLIDKLLPYITDTVWVGKMNHIKQRVDWTDVPETKKKEVLKELDTIYSDKYVKALVKKYKHNPKIKWKDSIQQVVGVNYQGVG